MTLREDLLKKYFAKAEIGGTMSINDLRDREFNGEPLSADEQTALRNFDRYRIDQLNGITNDREFHERYRQLQVMANLGDWQDFLNIEGSNN
ncbi:MAG: hypothetical protein L6Q81_05960 [Bacteroidia bacterium]|jgi:hypothetical protein|nr:hypothetical protein [Bacteroidia bacterium]